MTSDEREERMWQRDAMRDACRRHLSDLRAAHGLPPPDVLLQPTATPRRLLPEPDASYCTSPAELCAELMK